MKVWKKRGIEKETLVLLILALGFLVWFVGFHNTTRQYAEQSVSVTACKASVERNAKLHINGIQFPTSIDCPAQNIAITSDDSPNDKNEKIARAMYDCWYEYGQGKLDLYKGEGTFCSVCAFVDVKTDQPVTGVSDYLLNHQVPDKTGKLYYDYLASYQTSKAKDVLGALKSEPLLATSTGADLKGKNIYAVLFVYSKGKDSLEILARHLTAQTIAGEAGLIIGVGGGTLAAGGVMVGLATVGLVGGPPGWVIAGAGAVVFSVVYGGAELTTFLLSPDNVPEWASFSILRDWNKDQSSQILNDDMGCDYFPTRLE